jgi:putative acetyltransferase
MVRLIKQGDNGQVAAIIRTVMPEFGASGAGFAIHDSEVDNMFAVYTAPRSAYYVCDEEGTILGGGGIGQLTGASPDTCELKKMYFLPNARGKGLGQRVLDRCLETAQSFQYKYCYLETFNTMQLAMQLYEKNGFQRIPGPLGNTGHFACDTFYQLAL